MSLIVSLAVLAEGVATDARGTMTLVAVNPPALLANELPYQFSPYFVMIVEDSDADSQIIAAGRTITARVEAIGPDGTVLFVSNLRQVALPPPLAGMRARMQVIAQITFTATKAGDYTVSAKVTVLGDREAVYGEAEASRSVPVVDANLAQSTAHSLPSSS